MSVQVVLVFIIFVSLTNKTCSKNANPLPKKQRQDYTTEIALRIKNTYPTMADHLGDATTSSKRVDISTHNVRNKPKQENHVQ